MIAEQGTDLLPWLESRIIFFIYKYFSWIIYIFSQGLNKLVSEMFIFAIISFFPYLCISLLVYHLKFFSSDLTGFVHVGLISVYVRPFSTVTTSLRGFIFFQVNALS